LRIGVLALQGDFQEHVETLKRLGVEAEEIRLPSDLEGIDAIIIPGGESTTITRLLDRFGLRDPLSDRIGDGMPVMGTCAGGRRSPA
jgi:pyridoxal 5'-phosphate synthase pdxT subunit